MIIKPVNADVIYAVGYVPTRAAVATTRVIRVEYSEGGYVFDAAFTTGGDFVAWGDPSFHWHKRQRPCQRQRCGQEGRLLGIPGCLGIV